MKRVLTIIGDFLRFKIEQLSVLFFFGVAELKKYNNENRN